jgi:hypothetical protein
MAPLVDKNVVYKKICHAIEAHTRTNIKYRAEPVTYTNVHHQNGGRGKDQEEIIVFLKIAFITVVVVVAVERPKQPVHYMLVYHPGQAFHYKKCYRYYYKVRYIHIG